VAFQTALPTHDIKKNPKKKLFLFDLNPYADKLFKYLAEYLSFVPDKSVWSLKRNQVEFL